MAELATDDEAFLRTWDIPQTARYLIARGFVKPTLQFPDEMLGSAARVAVTLQEHCARQGHDVQVRGLAGHGMSGVFARAGGASTGQARSISLHTPSEIASVWRAGLHLGRHDVQQPERGRGRCCAHRR